MSNAPIPSSDVADFKLNVEDFDALMNGAGTYVDRFGMSRLTVDEFFRLTSYEVPVAFTTGLSISRVTQTVTYSGITYHALATAIPFTTTGTFNAAQWEVISGVSRQELASTDADKGASLVGGATRSVATYASVRSFTGSATRLEVGGRTNYFDGASGFFEVDESDSSSADNDGTILVDSLSRRWKRVFSGAVNAKWFGSLGNGIADDTAAFVAAKTYCLSTKTANTDTLGGGNRKLYIPTGMYLLSSTVTLAGPNGFELVGDGPQSTQIVFTGSSSTLFTFVGYLNCELRDLSIFSGTASIVGDLPTITFPENSAARTNTAINFDGAGGGTNFRQRNVIFAGWNIVYNSKTAANVDTHSHWDCVYYRNNYLWDNTNTQAVSWSFFNCSAYYNEVCFQNPGLSLLVKGGTWINPGDFLVGSLANTSSDSNFEDMRFETYQNIDAGRTPRLLVLSGTHSLTFRNCNQRGGGSLVGKTTGSLAGIYDIKLERCFFQGNWTATVGSSNNGLTSHIAFVECDGVPSVVQTLQAGQGFRPLNLEFRRHRNTTTGYIDRVFNGGLAAQANPVLASIIQDTIRFEAAVNTNTQSKSVPVFTVDPYGLLLVGVDVVWTNNTTNTCTIDVWQDSTKTTKLATFTTASASGVYQAFQADRAGMLAIKEFLYNSNPMYIEVTSAANAGTCKAHFTFTFAQST